MDEVREGARKHGSERCGAPVRALSVPHCSTFLGYEPEVPPAYVGEVAEVTLIQPGIRIPAEATAPKTRLRAPKIP